MVVLFLLTVHGLTPVSLLEKITVEGTVKHIAVHLCVSVALITDYFEECRAA